MKEFVLGFLIGTVVLMFLGLSKTRRMVLDLNNKVDSCIVLINTPDTTDVNVYELNKSSIDSLRMETSAISRRIRKVENDLRNLNNDMNAMFD